MPDQVRHDKRVKIDVLKYKLVIREERNPLICTWNSCTIITMKYEWSPKKNEWLKEHRKISFEQVIFHLSQGDVWKIADHPDQEKYPKQKIYFVIVEGYIYLVPYIIESGYIFLKTIIPSRKATRDYQKEQEL